MRPPPQRVVLATYEHNLKGITVESPRRALSVITGPSGSGKSSLAFQYAEGQRRYIESLSTYAKRSSSGCRSRCRFDWKAFRPAVAIEKEPHDLERTTVGRHEKSMISCVCCGFAPDPNLLHCVPRGEAGYVRSVDSVIRGFRNAECGIAGSRVLPLARIGPPADVEVAAQLRAAGFVRAQVDGELLRLDDESAEQRRARGQECSIIVDRLEAVETRWPSGDAGRDRLQRGEGVALRSQLDRELL